MENIGKLYTKHYNPDHHHCGSHLIFSEGALIPTHQSGKALYYNSIKTELKSPQKADQKKQQQQQQQQQNQQQQGKSTKVVFSNGGVNTALHDGAEHATAPNGKLLEKASNENGKVVENGNHGKFKPESSDERLDVSDDSRREKGTVQSCANGGELPAGSLTNGHFAKSSDVNGKVDDDTNIVLNGHSNGGSSNFSSNCSSPTNGLNSLPTPRRSLPSTRYSASVARELESECQSETSSVLTTSTPVNCSPHVQRRTEEEEAVRAV